MSGISTRMAIRPTRCNRSLSMDLLVKHYIATCYGNWHAAILVSAHQLPHSAEVLIGGGGLRQGLDALSRLF
jgi:hypothetical protein